MASSTSTIKAKRRLVAQTSSSGTYNSKLNSLYSAYNALSKEDKLNAYIVMGDYKYYAVAANGRFASLPVYYMGSYSSSVAFISETVSSVWTLDQNSSGNTLTDNSQLSNSIIMYLYTESV